VLPPTATVTVPPAAADTELSDQLNENEQVEGAADGGWQLTCIIGLAAGEGATVTVGVEKLPLPVMPKVPCKPRHTHTEAEAEWCCAVASSERGAAMRAATAAT
jgi:hypothetical protein